MNPMNPTNLGCSGGVSVRQQPAPPVDALRSDAIVTRIWKQHKQQKVSK